ncbi:MAG: hypothetical protein N4A74_11655 [Carboxylicivirga sp.]|nr:hypothetical protein [Carboxylicivirga sp.]
MEKIGRFRCIFIFFRVLYAPASVLVRPCIGLSSATRVSEAATKRVRSGIEGESETNGGLRQAQEP